MEITDVQVAVYGRTGQRLKAYATVTFDHCFVVRNLKIIEGKQGLFVAMPSQKPKVACGRCRVKHDVGAHFCAQCGQAIEPLIVAPPAAATEAGSGSAADPLAHRDIAHPITVQFRQYLQQKVIGAYEGELAKSHHAPAERPDAGEDAE